MGNQPGCEEIEEAGMGNVRGNKQALLSLSPLAHPTLQLAGT
jgi:hypothetical protein